MNESPLFSVIVPTYNRAEHLPKTLNSLLEQQFDDYEIIVVDDGSTDHTEALIRENFKDRLRYFKIENSERGAARNYGARMSKGQYISFFDSDDLAYPNYFREAANYIRNHPDSVFFATGYEIIDSTGRKKVYNSFGGNLNKQLIKGNFLSLNAVFLRSDIARNNPFWENREMAALEDWELWLRIASQIELHFHPVVTSAILNHEARSVIQTDKKKLVRRFELFLKQVRQNSTTMHYYGKCFHLLKGSCYTYIALHLALTGKHKGTALLYLIRGILNSPAELFKRRFMAILKHLVLRW